MNSCDAELSTSVAAHAISSCSASLLREGSSQHYGKLKYFICFSRNAFTQSVP